MRDYQTALAEIVRFEWGKMLTEGATWDGYEAIAAIPKVLIYSNLEMWMGIKDDYRLLFNIYLSQL